MSTTSPNQSPADGTRGHTAALFGPDRATADVLMIDANSLLGDEAQICSRRLGIHAGNPDLATTGPLVTFGAGRLGMGKAFLAKEAVASWVDAQRGER